tara:strand:- start:1770 stop:1958 length:189 start_codon:yes stop_codon:yes gene_type:complete
MTKIEHANTVPNTAKLLNVSASTVRREIRMGSIPHLKIGNRVLIPGWFLSELLTKPNGKQED